MTLSNLKSSLSLIIINNDGIRMALVTEETTTKKKQRQDILEKHLLFIHVPCDLHLSVRNIHSTRSQAIVKRIIA